MSLSIITLHVNGVAREVGVRDNETLLEAIRERLLLTGTKCGCEVGDCGACTVLMEGVPTFSCLVLAREADGRAIETIEGVAAGGTLHPLQQAFVELGAIQCGYCTPGMILTAKALLARTPSPDEATIRRELSGNLCRCTGYQKIIDAVTHAAATMQEPA